MISCPNCDTPISLPEELHSETIACTHCGQKVTLSASRDATGQILAKSARPVDQARRSSSKCPAKIGKFRIIKRLGAGGMGEVLLGHDVKLNRDVALKVLWGPLLRDKERIHRFISEARSAAQLTHPNVAVIFEADVEGEYAYIAMEYIDGQSLDNRLAQSGPMDWREATRVIRDAARGLAAAHEMGLVHRDVKPGNLIRNSKGETKVVDFGLVRALNQESHVTQEGRLLGTPAYMAPEQWSGGEVDARTDLYSLTCTFYHLLTGSAPFDAPSFPALGYQHRYETFPTLTPAAGFPAKVQSILERGSAKDPAERYQKATELIADLDAVLDGELSLPEAIPTIQVKSFKQKASAAIWPDLKRHATSPRILIAAGVLFVCMLLGVVFMVRTPSGDTKGSAKRLTAYSVPTEWPFDAAEAKRRQKETGDAVDLPVDFTNTIGMKFRLIPPGEFMMGSPADEASRENDEGPQHRVRITQPFYLGICEVTQGQYEAVMGARPWSGQKNVQEGSDYAASYVSWDDAVQFCRLLGNKEGRTYRLPTEAEWEYACRAGTSSAYHFGDGASRLGEYAWFSKNAQDIGKPYPQQVGQQRANPFGLYDMHGNVWEWCSDWYGTYPNTAVKDPKGPAAGSSRVDRGGSWDDSAAYCRSADRLWIQSSHRNHFLGFRVAAVAVERVLPEEDNALSAEPVVKPSPQPVPQPTTLPADLINSMGMQFKLIPAGAFLMGSPADEVGRKNDEGPQHQVRITQPFYLGIHEVTQGQYKAVMNDRHWKGQKNVREGRDYAASYVSWYDAVQFCRLLGNKEGRTYRLPTEAEWEYACRGGTNSAYYFGDSAYYHGDDLSRLGEYAWFNANALNIGKRYAQQVGRKRANPFGLYDVYGNVWEWCSDWYGTYTNTAVKDPKGPAAGSHRVLRGGGWYSGPSGWRSARRRNDMPGNRYDDIGFRVVLIPAE